MRRSHIIYILIYKLVRTEVEPEICACPAESVRKLGESVSKALGAVKSRKAGVAHPNTRPARVSCSCASRKPESTVRERRVSSTSLRIKRRLHG